MIGDVIGKPGRVALERLLPDLRQELDLDMVIANGENSAGGFGITPQTVQELLCAGVDFLTTGNHIWDKKEIIPQLDEGLPVIRPANYPPSAPGQGYMVMGDVMVMNLMGRVFLANLDCPFRTADAILEEVGMMASPPRIVLVDMHAEATSEKQAMGWYLDGRVSAVVGTHTHVPTADPRVLPKGHRIRYRPRHDRSLQLHHRQHGRNRHREVFDPDAAAWHCSQRPGDDEFRDD